MLYQLLSVISFGYYRILLPDNANLHFVRNSYIYASQFLNYMSDFEFVC